MRPDRPGHVQRTSKLSRLYASLGFPPCCSPARRLVVPIATKVSQRCDIRPHLTKTSNDNRFLLLLRDAGDTDLYENGKSGSRWRSALAMHFIEQPALQRCYGQFSFSSLPPR